EMVHARRHLVHNQALELVSDRQLDIDLRPARVSGRVRVAGDGSPLGDAVVLLERLAEGGGEGSLSTVGTAEDGSYAFPRVPSGAYRLGLSRDGYSVEARELTVEPSARLDGVDLEAVPTAGLRLWIESPSPPPRVTVAVLSPQGAVVRREFRAVGAQGEVDLATVPAGRWRLLLSAPGHGPESIDVAVPEGAGADPVTVRLRPASRVRVLVPDLAASDAIATLSLRDAAGNPFRSLDALAVPRGSWPVVAGRALLDGVPAGSWSLVARTDDGAAWTGSLEVGGGGDVTVELR
ncbi:MAG: carboxypeptidase-like regulatory domain-containing protein, partial [Acidobacteriota bacterium]